jgi:Gluconate 2-dehydrogenase subunit 3
MSDDVRDEPLSVIPDAAERSSVDGPLRGVFGRRAVLQSLVTGVGAAVLASPASAHVHQAATSAAKPAAAAAKPAATTGLVFFDRHAFDTIAVLGEQIVPGSRAAKVPEFLDRLLAVESTDTQKHVIQAIGAFERAAREAHGTAWKALTPAQATALLTKMSEAPGSEATRGAFELVKGAVAETYFATETGLKELGWNRSVMFAAPIACG